jgi:hypothetical protein
MSQIHTEITQEFARNRDVFEGLLKGLSQTEYRWKPSAEKWCLLEIICHLYDEECEDFRPRLKHVLENSQTPLPPINPVGWVVERNYIEQNFSEKIADFLQEREKSIQWLATLENANWQNSYKHPLFGDMSAEMFLTNWLAHDYIHIRQIINTKYGHLEKRSVVSLEYAGDW